MSKPTNEVIFEAPSKGMGDSPYIGNGAVADCRNLDISNIPGIAQLQFGATKKSASVIGSAEIPLWGAVNNDTLATAYVVTNAHKVYTSDNSTTYGTWTLVTHAGASTGHGNGLVIWKGYLVLAGDALLDFMLISSGVWTNGWGGFPLQSDTVTHPLFNSIDDKLYVGNGRYVNSIAENTAPFAPGTPGSYTASDKLVTLPTSYRVRCLEEVGANIYAGTFVGFDLTKMVKIAKIYPFSRSTYTLGLPVIVKECGVHQMVTIGNDIIYQAGTIGRWYITNGSTTRFLTRIPQNLRKNGATLSYPGAIIYRNGKIFSAITVNSAGSTGSVVYSFDTNGAQFVIANVISTGISDGNTAIGMLLDIGEVLGTNDVYLIGWYDGTSVAQGIDAVGEDNFTGSTNLGDYAGYYDTEIKSVGTSLENKTYTKLEYYLDTALASGLGVRVSYRLDSQSAFTLLGTYNFASEGAVRTANRSILITNAEQLQMRIALTTGSGATPRFKYLRLYG